MPVNVTFSNRCELVIKGKQAVVEAEILDFVEERELSISIGELRTKLFWNQSLSEYIGYLGGFEITSKGPKKQIRNTFRRKNDKVKNTLKGKNNQSRSAR